MSKSYLADVVCVPRAVYMALWTTSLLLGARLLWVQRTYTKKRKFTYLSDLKVLALWHKRKNPKK